MKRQLLILLACLPPAFSCERETPVPTAPEAPTAVLSLRAQLPATKLSVEPSGKTCWTEGDEIAVYNTEGEKFVLSLTDGAGTSDGTFTGAVSGTPGNLAVYPYALAGDTAGTMVLPWTEVRSDAVPCVLASSVSYAEGKPENLHFHHIAAVVDLTLHDIPAYARALIVRAGNVRICGTLSFDALAAGPLETQAVPSSRRITFPCGEGYGRDLHFRLALPPGAYSELSLCLLDGDETPIEGVESLRLGASARSLTAGDYVVMPALNVRSRVTRSGAIRKVEGIRWAAGNLMAESGGSTTEGFQTGWRIASAPYEFFGWDEVGTGTGLQHNQSTMAFDRFTWGGLAGDAWLASSGFMLPTTAKYNISGRVFSISSGSGDELDAAVVEGDARFATPDGGALASGSSLYGDVAFWASKGQYRMPKSAEIVKLRAGSAASPDYATGRAGYVEKDGNRIYGILLTSTPSWEVSTLTTTAVALMEADLESGVFLPKAGRGRFISGKNTDRIVQVNSQGYYRSATFSGLDMEKYPQSGYSTSVLGFRAANTCDYGYAVDLNSDAGTTYSGYGVGHVQKCLPVRPLLNTTVSEAVPDPLPQPDGNTLPSWSPGYLDIHFINAGRGECSLVILPDGTSIMIDAGEYETSSDEAVARKPSASVRPFKVYTAYARHFLKATGHDYLDFFVLSHFHIDHAGSVRDEYGTSGNGYCRTGVMAVYDDLPIKKLVDRLGPSGVPETSDYNAEFLEEYRKFAAYRRDVDGMEWFAVNMNANGNYKKQLKLKYDSSYACSVANIGGNGKYWNGSAFGTYAGTMGENTVSLTHLISYGNFDYYTGGDCGCQNPVMPLIVSGLDKKVEAMKANHHMYYNTFSAGAAAILQPKVTVAMISDKDKPGDPALSNHRQYGDLFSTNLHSGLLDGTFVQKEGGPIENLADKFKDYNGHFVIRVSPGGNEFYVYKLRDTDFSYSVEASYGPYTCH